MLYALHECQKDRIIGNWTKMLLQTLEKLWDIEQNLIGLFEHHFWMQKVTSSHSPKASEKSALVLVISTKNPSTCI